MFFQEWSLRLTVKLTKLIRSNFPCVLNSDLQKSVKIIFLFEITILGKVQLLKKVWEFSEIDLLDLTKLTRSITVKSPNIGLHQSTVTFYCLRKSCNDFDQTCYECICIR